MHDRNTTDGEDRHALQCMEIWGGNAAIHSAVSVPGVDAWISSDPCEGAAEGGDIHYISQCGAGKISRFFIADVSGHGATVAALASQVRGMMRRNINTVNQVRFARALNRQLLALNETGRFATALLATYFAPTDHLIVCNAGHPRPLWYVAAESTWQWLDQHTAVPAGRPVNVPLGIIEPTDYIQFAAPLHPGDVVLIYTDSLIEAAGPDGRQLGEAGLMELVQSIDLSDRGRIASAVLEAIADYRGGAEPQDDQTLLVLDHNGGDPPHLSLSDKAKVVARMLGLAGVDAPHG